MQFPFRLLPRTVCQAISKPVWPQDIRSDCVHDFSSLQLTNVAFHIHHLVSRSATRIIKTCVCACAHLQMELTPTESHGNACC